jgi:hypothetical protein
MKYEKIEKGINAESGKIVGKEERLRRSSWFGDEFQMILVDKKRAYSHTIDRNTRQDEQE